jgi:hypothetical protein
VIRTKRKNFFVVARGEDLRGRERKLEGIEGIEELVRGRER